MAAFLLLSQVPPSPYIKAAKPAGRNLLLLISQSPHRILEVLRMLTFRVLLKILGQTAFLFGFLGWGYGVLIQVTHPEYLPTPLSHLTLWIRVDTFTMVCFVVSLFGFILWRITKEATKSS
jgi:hypothetical protein